MQFLCLFSFVVVASYAAALPQPAELSGKYSSNVNNDLASGLEARSYQPVVDTLTDSVTLMSLKRRYDDSDESSEEDDDDSGQVPVTLSRATSGEDVENGPGNVPRNVKAAGETRGGPTGEGLIVYLSRALYISDKLKEWVNDFGRYVILVVYETFGCTDYSKTVRPLREATTALTKEVRDLLKAINDGIKNITRKTGPFKVQFKSIHSSFERVFGSYGEYFAALQTQLAKFEGCNGLDGFLQVHSKQIYKTPLTLVTSTFTKLITCYLTLLYPWPTLTYRFPLSIIDKNHHTSTTFSIYGLAAVSITYLRSILAPILGHQMEHVSKIDRRTTKHGARFRITVPEDRQRKHHPAPRAPKQANPLAYSAKLPTSPSRPASTNSPTSTTITADPRSQCCQHQQQTSCYPPYRQEHQALGHLRDLHHLIKFRFTVPGFDVIQHPATGPGRRGIALGIPSCFGGHEHGSAVGTMILAKVPNFTPECLWIVGSVYVGHSGATTNYSRREAFASIRQALDRVVPFDNNHPVLIFGDWNTDPQRLQRIVHSWGHGLTVMQFSGSQITRLSTVHGRRHSSIDHFVCNAPARALLTSPRVDRQTAVADHFVIRTSIRAEAQGQPPVPRAPTISRHHCLEATDRIATSNYWDVLADANAVADNLSLRLSPPATRSNRRLLSGTTKRAILASNTARQAFIAAATTNRNPDPVQCNTLRDEWSRLKAAATQLERVDGRKQWVKHADNLDRAVSDGRTDLVFAAARAMSGNSSRSAAVTPLYNSDGIVQYDPTSILRVMQGHYGSLAADTTGHSLDLQYWHDRQPIQVSPNTPPIRNSDILDQDFSWNQIAAALLQMSPRKAPGDDGITTAFYQAALYMPANTQEGVPPTPFARALLRVCGQVFASATIPRAWLCASIVSIDKKDGDPLNPGDKRGIALINVGLKLVCKVLQMRIERFVETNNLLSYEQAGFRKREEHSIQSPVGALLWKLQNMGFPRRTLAFLKALYTSSSARARAGSLLSDPFPVQRGVRQGCPLSGLLFNLFINDILDGVAPITVPGLPRDTNPIRGLMYADDVAVFADSEQSLLAASTAIEQWANQWEMQFGVAKCGIISFTGHLAPRLDNPLDIRLHGQLVSRVESYKYLGVLIDSKLDHSAWLKQKRSALEHTISALHPVLANHQLTVNYRSRIFSAVVMGKAYYGLELVGGNKSHLAPLQTTINKGIRLFTGARLSTAIGPLLVETGIGSLLTRSLVSRVRLLERSVTKRTPINAICSGTDNDVFTLNVQGQLVRSQRWFWSRRTKQLYRNRYWLTPQVRPKTVKQRHSFALMETLRTCGDSASLQKYVTRQFLDTSGFFKDPSFDQSRAHGTRYLMLARMDALWTARKAIQIGILVDTHPFSVDHCILCDQQLLSTSIAHLVVECEQVTGHRIQSGLVPAIQKSRLRLLGRALDPGVENVYTWLRGGVLNGEADLDQRWLDGTVEHESMGTRHDNRALAARLADFLQVAYRQYQSTLWKYHRDRLVEVG
ncbi:hypothetical protein BASA62_007981 [Batrachochytrium salamandrivorans]|nr:hypothetical protein BASA62_007981 [Batrachochytrium salamandrivorans]